MDEVLQAILDSLPPKPPRSKLEPYVELIQELRRRGRSYREIAGILANRCGVNAGTHTVYNFVRVRASAQKRKREVGTGQGRERAVQESSNSGGNPRRNRSSGEPRRGSVAAHSGPQAAHPAAQRSGEKGVRI